MEKFTKITSKAIPLPIRDVDTDMILPAQFMTSVSRDGYGQNLFTRLRSADPEFPLNKAEYADAKILLTETNFGCGSSREHAVWALTGAGFRVVIGKGFADIFYNNSPKNGLLLIVLPAAVIDDLMKRAAGGALQLTVDLESQQVTEADGRSHKFEFDSFRKHCMLEGLDDLDYIMAARGKIDSYFEQARAERFFSTAHVR
jgi:3-isopropylmalate/(R)-2-methylmalate dehydratase small subunit